MAHNIPTPPPSKLNNHYLLGEILDHLDDLAPDFPNIDFGTLSTLLRDVRDHRADTETQMRLFLRVFQNTNAYKLAFAELDADVQRQLRDFIKGKSAGDVTKGGFVGKVSPASKEHFKALDIGIGEGRVGWWDWRAFVRKLLGKKPMVQEIALPPGVPIIYEDKEEKKVMEGYLDTDFQNWGLSVKNKPRLTFVPTTVLGLQNLVIYAKSNGLRVRCSGYRHSWSPMFSGDGEILVSLLNLKRVTTLPDASILFPLPASNALNELKSITIDGAAVTAPGKKWVRVGAAVTADEFVRWSTKNNAWAVPLDVILVEVTIGGVNGPICHGAGHRHKTTSDLVRKVEYVDANGVHQTVSEPSLLRAAAGCFGLLGVVTHLTLELNAMTYAVMRPEKPDINLAIPPLRPQDVPLALQKTFTKEKIAEATKKFEDRVENDYYNEFFWFPYQQKAWVQCWNDTPDPKGAKEYPPTYEVWLQWIQNWLGGVIVETKFFRAIPGRWQAEFMATLTMASLPPQFFGLMDTEIKTQLPFALHFRRGIQNMRVRDMEFQIPIPSKKGEPDKPDWTIVQRAWWDIINLVYADAECPMRLALELRVMSDSDMIMAPQSGNKHGTASIEVLTLPDAVSDGEWQPFLQKVAEKWMSYEKIYEQKINCRPHWAKEWEGLEFAGMPARQYFKEVAYKDAIPEFRNILEQIGNSQNWKLKDLKERFSNELWDDLVFDKI